MTKPNRRRLIPSQLVDKQQLLDRFGLITGQGLCAMLGITMKTLLNRPLDKLPPFKKVGQVRVFHIKDIATYFEPDSHDGLKTVRRPRKAKPAAGVPRHKSGKATPRDQRAAP